MRPPCKDCKERAIGCHSTCEKYKEYCIQWEEIKRRRAEEKSLTEFLEGRKIKNRTRERYKR